MADSPFRLKRMYQQTNIFQVITRKEPLNSKPVKREVLKFHKRIVCDFSFVSESKRTGSRKKVLRLTENRYRVRHNILTFLAFYFVPGNWSGSFRLNDFDGWQEGKRFESFSFARDLRRLRKSFRVSTFVNCEVTLKFYFGESLTEVTRLAKCRF